MEKEVDTNFQAALLGFALDRSTGGLAAQLAGQLRSMILGGRARPGQRLPASRVLAAELSVSRTTVLAAYDQLTAEGYLDTRIGAETRVAVHLPEAGLPVRMPNHAQHPVPAVQPIRPLQPGVPDPALEPHRAWARALHDAWATPEPSLLGQADPQGWWPLRVAIAAHLGAWRGFDCSPDRIFVTAGTADSLELVSRALLPAGAKVLIEDPGFAPVARTLCWNGLKPCPIPVDAQGFDVARALATAPDAAAAIVAPSRQYPLGMTLPLPRRLALLDWAERRDALLIEDDYDSEFRYVGAPLPAMASIDTTGRTLYFGSFSKVLSAGLRVSFLVAPERFAESLRHTLAATPPRASLVPQPALARLMDSGTFATHLRRMRRVYARRQATLLAAARDHLSEFLSMAPEPGGMHLVARLTPEILAIAQDREWAARAAEAGLGVQPLSRYFTADNPEQGLVVGYAAHDDAVLHDAVATLAAVFQAG